MFCAHTHTYTKVLNIYGIYKSFTKKLDVDPWVFILQKEHLKI